MLIEILFKDKRKYLTVDEFIYGVTKILLKKFDFCLCPLPFSKKSPRLSVKKGGDLGKPQKTSFYSGPTNKAITPPPPRPSSHRIFVSS